MVVLSVRRWPAAAALLGAALLSLLPQGLATDDNWTVYTDPDLLIAWLESDKTLAYNHPGYHDDTITTVRVGLRISHFFGVDSKTKSYKIAGTLQAKWHDERLAFQNYNVTGFNHLEWAESKIWTPKLYFEDSVSEGNAEEGFLRSMANGEVLHERVLHLQLLCSTMKFTYYPFDDQECTIRILPLKVGAKYVELEFLDPGVTGFKGLSLGEWDNFEVRLGTAIEPRKFFDDDVDWPYADITFSMHRIVYSQFGTLILPSVLMTIMSYAGYWINPAAAPGRIALAMICVLATISQKASVQARIPTVSYEVWMDTWLTINLIFNFLAVVSYAVVNVGMQKRAAMNAQDVANKKTDEEKPPEAGKPEPGHDGGDPDEDHEHHDHSLRRISSTISTRLHRFRGHHLVYCDHIMRVVFPVSYIIVNIYMAVKLANHD